MTITIDPHAVIQSLNAAGADAKFAEAIVKIVGQADAQPATKADLVALEHRLTGAGYACTRHDCRLRGDRVRAPEARPAGGSPPSAPIAHPRSPGEGACTLPRDGRTIDTAASTYDRFVVGRP